MSAAQMRLSWERVKYENARRKHHFGFIPHRLKIEGRPELSLFSLNILFGGPKLHEGKYLPMVSALYEPDLETFHQDDNRASLRYHHIGGASHCTAVLTYDKRSQSYTGEKFVNGKCSVMVAGKDWNMFSGHSTFLGVVDSEPFSTFGG